MFSVVDAVKVLKQAYGCGVNYGILLQQASFSTGSTTVGTEQRSEE